ncbi:hypothetical protein [Streptomyces flaveus]|uniref:Uncharacterized protein n=1 Tax=Streptomyces flaveus TaxID=66370 RepID=A0A917VHZ8_9ACTN|nr:hypothetical protein [Streptomyces flaveus]GGK79898.1 hypothetical protein GCM10010094_46500 [Streptomyces flaveus]
MAGYFASAESWTPHPRPGDEAIIRIADIRAWCEACGAPGQAPDLIAANRQSAEMYVKWRRLQRTGLRRLQESGATLYQRTRHFRVFDDERVHTDSSDAVATLSEPGQVDLYLRAFQGLSGNAVYGAAARGLVTQALAALDD